MSKIYLKTYFYAPHEIELIIANLKECYDYIDKMIVCEYDINHTGEKRKFQYRHLKELIPPELSDKLDYHPCEVYDETVESDNESLMHKINEPVMRSFFTKLYDFSDDDIIISVDADEILYGEKIEYLIEEVKKYGTVRLKLRQFFYKKTYLWEDKDFICPIATYYGSVPVKYPSNWRDVGKVTDDYMGCHFSWCMDVEAMINKLHTYGHPRYKFCADRELLEDAIQNKKYPFDLSVDFRIRELSSDDEMIPLSMREGEEI